MRPVVATKSRFPGFFGRVLLLFLPIALLIGAAGWMVCRTETRRLHDEHANLAQDRIDVGVKSIERTLQSAVADLVYLAHRPANRQLSDNKLEARLADMASDWTAFMQAKGFYDQIRWIDETGMERLRIDYDDLKPNITPYGQLQYKGDRYYFKAASALDEGEIYISPLDLNIENGSIEIPYKPASPRW